MLYRLCILLFGFIALEAKIHEFQELPLVARKDTFHARLTLRTSQLQQLFTAIANNDNRMAIGLMEQDNSLVNVTPEDAVHTPPLAGNCRPLLLASYHGNAQLVAYLLEKGADVHAVDTEKMSALDYLMSNKKSISPRDFRTIFFILRKHGVSVDDVVFDHNSIITHLINSQAFTDEELSFFVQQVGLSLYFTGLTPKENNAYLSALDNNYIKCASAIKQRMSIANCVTLLVEFLVNNKIDINSRYSDGKTVLFMAAQARSLSSLDECQLHGAKLNVQDNGGNTAFHIFIHSLLQEVIQDMHTPITKEDGQIIETFCYFANVDLQNNDGNTVYHYIAALLPKASMAFKQIAKYLDAANARTDLPNAQGITVRDLLEQETA